MHPLQQRLAGLRRRVRRRLAFYGLSRLAAVLLGCVMVLGLADYLIRFDNPGIRLMSSLLAAGLTVWAGYRYVWGGLSARLGDLRLAHAVERKIPALGDRLATAIDFLRQADDDPTAGSPALRRAVIDATAAQAAGVDFAAAVDPHPARRAGLVATAAILAAAILVALDPGACRTAVTRLAQPLSAIAWPQRNHLELRRRVEQIARGQTFELEVVAAEGTPLPAEVRIHYRTARPDGSSSVESERMRRQGPAMVGRRENVTRPFSYRVEGGDDHSQPWIDVAVVEPPAVQSLTVRLIPPDYTAWPAYDSNRQIRALAGTQAEFRAAATKPLASAAVVLDEQRTIPAELIPPDRFRVPGAAGPPLVLAHTGSYRFSLTDRQGISASEADRFEIRVVPDGPPSAVIEQPTGNLYVTPRGVVPLRLTAKDDLAVAAIDLVFSRGEEVAKQGQRVNVYRGPARPAPQPAFSPAPSLPAIDFRWDLGPLSLAPKAAVAYYVEARDYAGAVGRSEPRRLAVVTADDLLQRLAERQTLLAAELGRVVAVARESRAQVAGLETRLAELGRLEQLDVDHLQAAAMGQRQADLALTSRSDGVAMAATTILADVEHNRLDAPAMRGRMQGLLAEIDRLQREHLPPIDQELTAAIKAAQIGLDRPGRTPPDAGLKSALERTAQHQDQLLVALEQMLNQLAQWQSYRRLQRDLEELLREQEELSRAASELGRQTIGRELNDLLPQQVAELKRLAGRQMDLSLRLDQLQDEIRRAATALAATDAPAAQTLGAAAEEATRLAVGARMRSVRAALDGNQMGQAAAGQRQIAADLRSVLGILSGAKQPASAGADMETLAEAARRLRTRQETLLGQTRQTALAARPAPPIDQLAGQQRSLAEQARPWVEQLGQHSAFGLVMAETTADMQQAARLLDRRQTANPTQQAQQAAMRRLSLLLEAMAPEAAAPPAEQGGTPGAPSQPAGAALSLPQLKLVRLMQQDLLTRTAELHQAGTNAPAATQRYAELSAEQGRLAEMLIRLLNTEQ